MQPGKVLTPEEIQQRKNAAWQHVGGIVRPKEMYRPSDIDHRPLYHLIVCLRRNIDWENDSKAFHEYMNEHHLDIINSFTTRWLVSITDTYADVGRTPVERSNAILISTVVNHIKLMDTYKCLVVDGNLKADAIEHKSKDLWDGIRSFAVKHGDMVENLYTRIDRVQEHTPILYKIWKEVLHRIENTNNTFSDLQKLHPRGLNKIQPRRPSQLPQGKQQ